MKKMTIWRILTILILLVSLGGCASLSMQTQINEIQTMEELPEGYRVVTGRFSIEPMADHYDKALTWIYYPYTNGMVDQSINPMLLARNSFWNQTFYTALKIGDSYIIRLPSIIWDTVRRDANSASGYNRTMNVVDFDWIEVTFAEGTQNLYLGELVLVITGKETYELRIDDDYENSNSAFKAKFGVEKDLGKASIRILTRDELEEIGQNQ